MKANDKKVGFPKGNKNPNLSKVRKEMFQDGLLDHSGKNNSMYGKTPWNKGLTKATDERIKKMSENMINHSIYKNKKRNAKIKKSKLGKMASKKTKEKMRISHLKEKNPMWKVNRPKEWRENQRKVRAKQILPKKDTTIEVKIQNFLKKLGIDFFTHQYMKIKHGYQCDILIPSMNLVIECDGDYWHKYPLGNDIDHVRTSELLKKGFKVLRLWEFEIKKMDIGQFQLSIKNT